MEPTHKFQLGDNVKDRVTGLKGIVTAYHHWFTGCDSATVSPQALHEGKPVEASNIDVTRLELVTAGKVPVPEEPKEVTPATRKGGPQPTVRPTNSL